MLVEFNMYSKKLLFIFSFISAFFYFIIKDLLGEEYNFMEIMD